MELIFTKQVAQQHRPKWGTSRWALAHLASPIPPVGDIGMAKPSRLPHTPLFAWNYFKHINMFKITYRPKNISKQGGGGGRKAPTDVPPLTVDIPEVRPRRDAPMDPTTRCHLRYQVARLLDVLLQDRDHGRILLRKELLRNRAALLAHAYLFRVL